MNIKTLTSLFHDGSITAIYHMKNKIIFSMESAETDKNDIIDNFIVLRDNRICGNLHLEEIKSVTENGQLYVDTLKMKHKDAEIFHLEVTENKVELQIKWNSLPPKPYIDEFSTLEIEAGKIWWENKPQWNGTLSGI